jgi:hypothetical protein
MYVASQVDKAFFEKHGYINIKDTGPEFMEIVTRSYEFITKNHSTYFSKPMKLAYWSKDNTPKQVIDVLRGGCSELRQIVVSSIIKNICVKLMGNQRFFITHAKLSIKFPNTETEWFAHQDNAYKTVNGGEPKKGITLGVFLEDSSLENGTIEVFPGSHLLGVLPHQIDHDQLKLDDNAVKNIKFNKPEPMLAKQGEVVAFSLNTLHRSGKNTKEGSLRPFLIFEVEPFTECKLDGYGHFPTLINGRLKIFERLTLLPKLILSGGYLKSYLRSNKLTSRVLAKFMHRKTF